VLGNPSTTTTGLSVERVRSGPVRAPPEPLGLGLSRGPRLSEPLNRVRARVQVALNLSAAYNISLLMNVLLLKSDCL
jgi:hypothetical protein